jgi:hypothetical protein
VMETRRGKRAIAEECDSTLAHGTDECAVREVEERFLRFCFSFSASLSIKIFSKYRSVSLHKSATGRLAAVVNIGVCFRTFYGAHA